MPPKQTIEAQNAAPASGPYSQAIKVPPLIFTSGQLPADESGNIDLSLSVALQTERCIRNIAAILEAGGSSLDIAIKTTVFLTDMSNFAEVNNVYEKYFTSLPARSCVAVKELPKRVPVEIECIAMVS
ncbi:YjgF-like protein [Aaosphaeria arxii CBS 175.79]|uniref:YjgF-like protein n=1 Tax=Aaosphaeria arxii CBS 175.79 TaxID=1450172 RepID=A0A6A5XDR1_9PLEO|nr:YjgF-like protein [Aaosphaeria arxii CBS 175.79]KAF2010904.1 YjgF-like protein [Aaosphaeria arxii CBS 175.79]